MSDVLKTLQEARDLISDPYRWTQRANARDKHGTRVTSDSLEAVCWCAVGAVNVAAARRAAASRVTIVSRAMLYLTLSLPEGCESGITESGITEYNDGHKHEEVLVLLGLAIKRAEVYADYDTVEYPPREEE